MAGQFRPDDMPSLEGVGAPIPAGSSYTRSYTIAGSSLRIAGVFGVFRCESGRTLGGAFRVVFS